jgi:hypothetical protein
MLFIAIRRNDQREASTLLPGKGNQAHSDPD